MRDEGAGNITWVFHVNGDDDPPTDWNRLERYYPGSDVVDWIGVSAYGAQSPTESGVSLRETLDAVYPRLTALPGDKPIVLLEFGSAANHPTIKPAEWADAALADLFAKRWPRMVGFSWWNEQWDNDDDTSHDSNMQLQDIPALAKIFHQRLNDYAATIQESPVAP